MQFEVQRFEKDHFDSIASRAGESVKQGSPEALQGTHEAQRPDGNDSLCAKRQTGRTQGVRGKADSLDAIADAEPSIGIGFKRQIDNIYYSNAYVIAAVTIDRKSLVFFDGLGWCADIAIAKKYATLGKAVADAQHEPPTHHPLEVWKVEDSHLQLACRHPKRRQTLPSTFQLRGLAA